jgi:uncharacterized protein (DUF2249 family)
MLDVLLPEDPVYPFDVRGIARRFRHAATLGALEMLNPGETLRYVNDHEPIPLLEQLHYRFGPDIEVSCIAREVGRIVLDLTRSDPFQVGAVPEVPDPGYIPVGA